MNRVLRTFLLACLAGCGAPEKQRPVASTVAWEPWSEGAFERAGRDKKLVLLDLGAVWCHWCHVMDKETYGDAEVASVIKEHFVAIHVNQDERPDLANRYEDYGWPATIVFAADGTELGKFRGFMPPGRMKSLLQAFVDDPTPGPSAIGRGAVSSASSGSLSKEIDDGLHQAWEMAYDRKEQGWGEVLKYLDPDCVELAMVEGRDEFARPTLDAMLGLIDPAWGGVYQYSDGGVWTNPHFEKIMSFQAEDLRIFSLAYRIYGDERYLKAARDIERYLFGFLQSPEGSFYASQDADLSQGEHGGEYFALGDEARRAKGMPRVDRHVYARENGWAICGLASLYRATGNLATLDAATRAAEWTIVHRGSRGGGFRHDESDSAGPFLADSIAMARAFFELHQATQDKEWLVQCELTLGFVEKTFRVTDGYATAATSAGAAGKPWAPRPQTDENIAVARLCLRVHAADEVDLWKTMSDHAMKYIAGLAPSANGVRAAGILLASRESGATPVAVTVVGAPGDPRTRALLRAALGAPASFEVVKLRTPGSSPDYPLADDSPTAYACSDGACSSPIHDPGALRRAATPARHR